MTGPRRRWASTAVVGAAVAVAVLLAGCAGSSSEPSSAPSRTDAEPLGRFHRAETFALGLGVDLADAGVVTALGRHDLVVVDGEVDEAQVARLQGAGAVVLGYLSVGTLEPGRPWFAEAEERGWLLDHWDDWDEWYAAVDRPGLRDLLLAQAEATLGRGFDGLFLDNVDMVEGHPDQAEGMEELVADLDELLGPDRALMSQNGDGSIDRFAEHLDGWNREDVSTTYDFDTEAYVAVSDEDHRSAVATLARLHDEGLLVTATDYADADADDDAEPTGAAAAACRAGALPFASDIDLTRIPDPPLRCG